MIIHEVVEKPQTEVLCGRNIAVLNEIIQVREQEPSKITITTLTKAPSISLSPFFSLDYLSEATILLLP